MPPAQAGLISPTSVSTPTGPRRPDLRLRSRPKGCCWPSTPNGPTPSRSRPAQLDVQLRVHTGAATVGHHEVRRARRLLVAQAVRGLYQAGRFLHTPRDRRGQRPGSGRRLCRGRGPAPAARLERLPPGARPRTGPVFRASGQRASVRAATRLLAADRAAASSSTGLRCGPPGRRKGRPGRGGGRRRDANKRPCRRRKKRPFWQSIRQLPGLRPRHGGRAVPLGSVDRSERPGLGRRRLRSERAGSA